MVSPGVFSVFTSCSREESYPFRDYQKQKSLVPVKIVTPDDGYYLHTFYDVSPFSPSGKLLAVTKLPFQDRRPEFGDKADICIIDLENETIQKVYSTKGWGFQLGANLNWGATDRYIYTNDIIDNAAVCVRIDLETKEVRAFSGPKYHLSPDGNYAIGFPLDIINATQKGYGVPEFRQTKKIQGAPSDEGLWETNLNTGEKSLLVSLEEAVDNVTNDEYLKGGNCYFIHLNTGEESMICSVFTDLKHEDNTLRLDPHPAWSNDYKKICFNGAPGGKRQVLVADLESIFDH